MEFDIEVYANEIRRIVRRIETPFFNRAEKLGLEEDTMSWDLVSSIVNKVNKEARLSNIELEAFKIKTKDESAVGADLCVIADIDLPGFHQSKGILIQAKKETRGNEVISTARHDFMKVSTWQEERARLSKQVEDMLNQTAESYVMVYGKQHPVITRATNIEGLRNIEPALPALRFSQFFYQFILCLFGDARITAHDYDSLTFTFEELRVLNAMLVRVGARSTE